MTPRVFTIFPFSMSANTMFDRPKCSRCTSQRLGMKTKMEIFGYRESFSRFYQNFGLYKNEIGYRKYGNQKGYFLPITKTKMIPASSDRFRELLYSAGILPPVIPNRLNNIENKQKETAISIFNAFHEQNPTKNSTKASSDSSICVGLWAFNRSRTKQGCATVPTACRGAEAAGLPPAAVDGGTRTPRDLHWQQARWPAACAGVGRGGGVAGQLLVWCGGWWKSGMVHAGWMRLRLWPCGVQLL
jgi:hypothetical protein